MDTANKNKNYQIIPYNILDCCFSEKLFKLIAVVGVDYLFTDHRLELELINKILKDDGHFFIERNVFIDTEAFTTLEVFDIEDLFGHNSMMINWFSEEQFEFYISQIFDVVDRTRIVRNIIKGRSAADKSCGWLCKKKRSIRQNDETIDQSWYDYNINHIKKIAANTSIKQLELLARNGFSKYLIYGTGIEAEYLSNFVSTVPGVQQIAFVSDDKSKNNYFRGWPLVRDSELSALDGKYDAILLASTRHQDEITDRLLQRSVNKDVIFPCFRTGKYIPFFLSSELAPSDFNIQIKAFLPATLAGF